MKFVTPAIIQYIWPQVCISALVPVRHPGMVQGCPMVPGCPPRMESLDGSRVSPRNGSWDGSRMSPWQYPRNGIQGWSQDAPQEWILGAPCDLENSVDSATGRISAGNSGRCQAKTASEVTGNNCGSLLPPRSPHAPPPPPQKKRLRTLLVLQKGKRGSPT